MRVRSRFSDEVALFRQHFIDDPPVNQYFEVFHAAVPFRASSEEISDDAVGGKSDKDCQHARTTYSDPIMLTIIGPDHGPENRQSYIWMGKYIPPVDLASLVDGTSDLAAEYASRYRVFRLDFFTHVLNGWKQRVLVVNFSIELREMRSTVMFWTPYVARLKKFVSTMRRRRNRPRGPTFGDIARELQLPANTFLGLTFGLLPFISDVRGIARSLNTMRDSLTRLRKRNGKGVKIREQRVTPIPIRSSGPRNIQGYSAQDYKEAFLVERTMGSVKFSGSATLDYDLSGIGDFELAVRSLASQWGLNNPLGIVWEAIPFSFVVDWFMDVSAFVERHLTFSLSPPFRIKRYSTSMKREDSYAISVGWAKCDMEDASDFPLGSFNFVSLAQLKSYSRKAGVDSLEEGFQDYLNLPGAYQLVQSIALAIQRVH